MPKTIHLLINIGEIEISKIKGWSIQIYATLITIKEWLEN